MRCKLRRVALWTIVQAIGIAQPAFVPAAPVIRNGDVLAVCGDSITEQKVYSVYLEDYLLMCQPVLVQTMQCGWGGAVAPHFAGHMQRDVVTLRPTVATTAYGMNDGGYNVSDLATEERYRDGLVRIVRNFKAGHTPTVIIGSPGAVDTHYFRNPRFPGVLAGQYNQTLGRLGEIGREVAASEGVLFADLHTPLLDAMAEAKAALGDEYPVCGEIDGVHAGPPGHLVMAYAFLKAMGFDGQIATIKHDMLSGDTMAGEGQQVISSKPGEITLASSRYPFCFFGGKKDAPDDQVFSGLNDWNYGDAAMTRFCPFNQDLNRYMLVVTGLNAPKGRITWGDQSKAFSAEELSKGINLAAEFLRNPFVKPFMEVNRAVEAKQGFETLFVRDYLSDKEPNLLQVIPARAAAIKSVEAGLRDIQAGLLQRCAEAVKPVTHTIKIEEIR